MTSSSMRFSAGEPVAWTMNTSPPRMFSLIRTDTSPSSKRSTSASPSGVLSFSQMALASGRLAFPLKMRHGSKSRSPEAMLRARMRRGGHPPGRPDPDQASRPGSGWLGREDSNLQYRDPKSRALPLGHAPPTERDFRHGPPARKRPPGESPGASGVMATGLEEPTGEKPAEITDAGSPSQTGTSCAGRRWPGGGVGAGSRASL